MAVDDTDHAKDEASSNKSIVSSPHHSNHDITTPSAPMTDVHSPSQPEQDPEKQTKSAAGSHGDIPDGGLKAWLQVLGGFMLFFNTWGILNTFGVYQTYYESGVLFQESSSNISWIGSIQATCVLLIGGLTGPIFDRGYLRLLLCVGAFGIVFGHMMLSLCHEYWQVILAQGFVVGIGGGCLYIPAIAILPTYFSKKIGLVIGLAASGSSTGGVLYPIMFYRLVNEVGFSWGTRIIGFVALVTLLIPIVVMKQRVKPAKARAILDVSAFTDLPYISFTIGTMLGFAGLYVGLFYISYFGQSTGITDDSLSFYLIPILNAASIFGRTLPNIVADKIGPLNVIIPGALVVGILLICNLAVHNVPGIIVNTIFFGFFSGVFVALPPVCFVHLTKDKSKIGTRMGQGFAIISLGVLAGGPGGGGILQRNPNSLDWTGTWIYGGVTVLAAAAIFVAVRFMLVGLKLTAKA